MTTKVLSRLWRTAVQALKRAYKASGLAGWANTQAASGSWLIKPARGLRGPVVIDGCVLVAQHSGRHGRPRRAYGRGTNPGGRPRLD